MAEEVSYESFFQIKLMIVERIAETGNGNEDYLSHILIVYLLRRTIFVIDNF